MRSQRMSFSSDALREEAARFRRMKFLIADPQALKAIEDYARELEQRAEALDVASAPPEPSDAA